MKKGNKIHAKNQDYINATLCGENRVVKKTWDRDKVTCRNCLRILSKGK